MADEPIFPPNTKIDDMPDLTPEESAAVFGTKYDSSIDALRRILTRQTGFTHEEHEDLVRHTGEILKALVPLPKNLTVGESLPYVELSDLLVLGALAHETLKRAEQVALSAGMRP